MRFLGAKIAAGALPWTLLGSDPQTA